MENESFEEYSIYTRSTRVMEKILSNTKNCDFLSFLEGSDFNMRISINTTYEEFLQRFKLDVNNCTKSPSPYKTSHKDELIGSVHDDRIWIQKTKDSIPITAFPRRFVGKIKPTVSGIVITGRFQFIPQSRILASIMLLFPIVFLLKNILESNRSSVDYMAVVQGCLFVYLCLLCANLLNIFYKEKKTNALSSI